MTFTFERDLERVKVNTSCQISISFRLKVIVRWHYNRPIAVPGSVNQ